MSPSIDQTLFILGREVSMQRLHSGLQVFKDKFAEWFCLAEILLDGRFVKERAPLLNLKKELNEIPLM